MDSYAFLEKYGLRAEDVDTAKVLDLFSSEMKAGLNGKKSSLQMIATYATVDETIPYEEPVIVMDAGGTNFRTSLLTFHKDGTTEVEDFRKVGMPGAKEYVSFDQFYGILADNIERFMGKSKKIGFCFSYAAEILENHDGIPLMFSKEIKAPEVLGKPIGASLLAELRKRGYDTEGMTVSILNDTVATLLAAKAAYKGAASTYVGFILGTGTNTAYVEKNANIGKIRMNEGSQIINVESGNLHIELSSIDQEFMATTKDPSSYYLEKKISGAYLGPFADFVLRKAVQEGVFSEGFQKAFASVPALETKDMGAYLDTPYAEGVLKNCVVTDEDSKNLWDILKAIIERSGKLTAINMAAAVLATEDGKSPNAPVVINADGTTFYKLAYLEFYSRKYLDEILEKQGRRYYTIVNIENSPTIGAAIGGLCL